MARMENSKDHKVAADPLLDCQVIATMSLCCGIVHGGWKEPEVMHTGACRGKHGGELGRTYYLTDSGMTMDACGVMLPRD